MVAQRLTKTGINMLASTDTYDLLLTYRLYNAEYSETLLITEDMEDHFVVTQCQMKGETELDREIVEVDSFLQLFCCVNEFLHTAYKVRLYYKKYNRDHFKPFIGKGDIVIHIY